MMTTLERGTDRDENVNRLQRTIRELMDAQGMGIADLGRATGIPRQTLYNLLSPANADEKRQPRPETLHKIARALKVRESLLLESMNETKGYEVERVEMTDPSIVALLTVSELLSQEEREMMVSIAKTMLSGRKRN
jgi:transcriptional regulator with XRE-family HTH domain